MGTTKQQRGAEAVVARWKHPEGTRVVYIQDNGRAVLTRTRSAPWVLGGHTAVVLIDGRSGGMLLERVHPLVDRQADALSMLEQQIDAGAQARPPDVELSEPWTSEPHEFAACIQAMEGALQQAQAQVVKLQTVHAQDALEGR